LDNGDILFDELKSNPKDYVNENFLDFTNTNTKIFNFKWDLFSGTYDSIDLVNLKKEFKKYLDIKTNLDVNLIVFVKNEYL
jgi:hypothetical protein